MASEAVLARLNRIGQGALTPSQGLAALGSLLRGTEASASPVVAVNPFNWAVYAKNSTPGGTLFEEFAIPHVPDPLGGAPNGVAAAGTAAGAASGAASLSTAAVLERVAAAATTVLGERIGDDDPLMSAGLDSLGSVEFANVLRREFQVRIPATLVFDHPTLKAVAAYITSVLPQSPAQASKTAESISAVHTVPGSSPSAERGIVPRSIGRPPVFILATVARPLLEGSAGGCALAASREFLDGVDAIRQIPLQRWDLETARAAGGRAEMTARFGAFLREVEAFDASAFDITPGEALVMDPQHRCILEACAEAITNAGMAIVTLPCQY